MSVLFVAVAVSGVHVSLVAECLPQIWNYLLKIHVVVGLGTGLLVALLVPFVLRSERWSLRTGTVEDNLLFTWI